MTINKMKQFLETLYLLVLYRITWNCTTVSKLFVVDKNTWDDTSVYTNYLC